MSLIRIAVRVSAIQALKENTLVGTNVIDSAIGTFQTSNGVVTGIKGQGPFVAVYTDSATTGDVDLKSLVSNGLTEIIFETGITMTMTETDEETGESRIVGLEIPATDAALEMSMDVVMRQIGDVLTNPDNEWAQIYSGLILNYTKTTRSRVGNADDGTKLAGQQLKIEAQLIDDPSLGDAIDPGSAFGAFLAKAEASTDDNLIATATKLREYVHVTDEGWTNVQRMFGMTAGELLALGLGPLGQDEDRSTPPLAEATAEIEGIAPVTVSNE